MESIYIGQPAGGFYPVIRRGHEVRLPRVSSVLARLDDFSFVKPDVMERAAEFGRKVHRIVELACQGRLQESSLKPAHAYEADLTPILQAWLRCMAERDVKRPEVEVVVASLKHGYAGRLDLIADVSGVRSVIEIKSRPYNPIREPLQTIAYLEAYNENKPAAERARRRFFCELRLDGAYDWRVMKGKQDFHYFRCLLAIHHWEGKNGCV